VRPVKQPEGQSKPDGRIASQFHLLENALEKQMSPEIKQRRDELEQAIFELRDHRNDMDEAAYFERLEALLIPFAELYAELDQTPESEDSAPPEDDLYFE
jgi:DNA-binding protein H-NS